MKSKSEDNGVDLGSCQKVLHKVKANTVELINATTGCIIDRVNKVSKGVEPLRAKLEDTKKVLSEFKVANAKCVSDHNTFNVAKISCIKDVSNFFNTIILDQLIW